MRKCTLGVVGVLVTFLLAANAASAATYVVPRDDEMIARADGIATVTVVGSYTRLNSQGLIETVNQCVVDDALKGPISKDDVIEIVELGGTLGNRVFAVADGPRYNVGGRYLVFLEARSDFAWRTYELALGEFPLRIDQAGRRIAAHQGDVAGWSEDGQPFREHVRLTVPFLQHIRDVVARRTTSGSYFLDGTVQPTRRPRSVAIGTQPRALDFDLKAATQLGVSKWDGYSGATINYSVSNTPATGDTLNLNDGEFRVIPDDPHGDVSGTFNGTGVVATAFYGGVFQSNNDPAGNSYPINITKSDIIVNDGVSSSTIPISDFETALTHEIGHTLGARHSDQTQANDPNTPCAAPLPCSTNAVMRSYVVHNIGGTLQSYDRDFANEVYGNGNNQASYTGPQYCSAFGSSGVGRVKDTSLVDFQIYSPACSGPTINTQPASKTIGGGQSTTLSVSATSSSGGLSYQWYQGTSGTTTTPVGSSSSSYNTGALTSTTSYWVRVTDGCGTTPTRDSNTATVTVNCNPAITSQPPNRTISSGSSTILTVGSSQAASFEWYRGTSGDTSSGILGTSSSFNTGSLTSTTQFWVRAKTSCGSTDSNTATVTVTTGCNGPSITTQPADQTISSGSTATIHVAATGDPTITYTLFQGACCSTASPVSSNTTGTFTTPALTSTTQYWVRASNSCSTTFSRTVTVTVSGSSCVPITISEQPAGTTISSGSNAILQVIPNGTGPFTYQWYIGTSGDTSSPIDNSNQYAISVKPTVTTTYWARVTNDCSTVDSNSATVTVSGTGCVPASIPVQPEGGSVLSGQQFILQVLPGGSPKFSYQWYVGQSGDTSQPIANSNQFAIAVVVKKTTSYWVRVTNDCGTADSDTVTVTTPYSRRHAVRRP